MLLSLLVPFAVHGIYSFSYIDGGKVLRFVYYVTVILLYAICFIITHTLSRRDNRNEVVADALIKKAHPGASVNDRGEGRGRV